MPPNAPGSTIKFPRQRDRPEPDEDEAPSTTPEPIPGMKGGWYYRPADRMILHSAAKDGPLSKVLALPPVVGVVTHLTDDGVPIRTEYQLLGPRGRKRIITEDELDRGTWAAKVGMARPSGNDARLAAATIIRNESHRADQIPARTHYNEAGDLVLPDPYAQPFGYLTCAGTEKEAREAWEEIGAWTIRDAKAALVLGAVFVGPVLDSLGVLAHILNLTGPGQQGKSTQLMACAATLGNVKPRSQMVMMTWNASKQGITQSLRQRGFLPVLLDEHSSSGRTVKESSREFSQIVAGAVRAMGTADGSPRESDGFWWSILVSSSNDPLKYQGQSEDLATRLQELPAPFWPNLWVNADGVPADPAGGAAEHLSKRIKRLAKNSGGWPLHWAVARGMFRAENLAAIKRRHLELCAQYGPHVGGIPDTIAELYMAWVVGAEMLGAAIEVPEVGSMALVAAGELLRGAVQEAAEANTPDGELLWLALDGMRIEASAYPPMDQVADVARDGMRRVRGFIDSESGQWWVVNAVVQEAASAAGLENVGAALRHLDEAGVHLRGDGKNSQRLLPRSLRGKGLGIRMHCFDTARADVVFASEDERNDPGTTTGTTTGTTQVVPENGAATWAGTTGTTGTTGSETDTHMRASGLQLELLPTADDDAVETAVEDEDERGHVAPRRHDATTHAATQESAEISRLYPTPDERVTDPAWSKLRRTAAAVGVLAADGLHLPNRVPVPMALPSSVDEAVPLMEAYGLRTLYLHADAVAAIGLPDYASRRNANVGPQQPVEHPWAEPAPDSPIVAMSPAGLSAWMTVKVANPDDPNRPRRLSIAVPCYEDRFDKAGLTGRGGFGGAEDGATLLDAVMIWTLSTMHGSADKPQVIPYYMNPNKTGEDLAGGRGRTDVVCEAIRDRAVPPVADQQLTPVMVPPRWHRAPTEDERGREWVHQYDKTAAWLAAYSNVGLGIGEPVHASGDVPYNPELAGRWRVADVPGHGIEGLPEFRFCEAPDGGYWLRTPAVELLREIYPAWSPTVLEAWYWPETKRALQGMYRLLNGSRRYILDAIAAGRPGASWAKQVNGRIYQSFRGYLSRVAGPNTDHETGGAYAPDIYWRPDWAGDLLELACANTYRALVKFAASGHRPLSLYVDAAAYASDEADPELAKPAAMVLGDAGGNWGLEGSAPMAAIGELLDSGKPAHDAIELYLNPKDGD